jgi:alpha-tubulin suppressor-like RCC1 family protein
VRTAFSQKTRGRPSKSLSLRNRHFGATLAIVERWRQTLWGLLALGCADSSPEQGGARPAQIGEVQPVIRCGVSPCVTSLALGQWHTCATTDDERVWCWGFREEGATGQVPLGEPSYVELPTPVPDMTGQLVRAGGSNTCVQNGPELECWGYLVHERVPDGMTPKSVPEVLLDGPIEQLSVADRHICVLHSDGVPACYGANEFGQLARETPRPADYPPSIPNIGGYPSFELLPAETVEHVKFLAARSDVTCAVDYRGGVSCWGSDISAVLGFGDESQQLDPVAIPGLSGILHLSVGDFHACAVAASGKVSCWGKDIRGSLGGDGRNQFPPGVVAGITDAVQVACAASASCAVVADGAVWCWGSNSTGQLGDGSADDEDHAEPRRVDGLSGVVSLHASDAAFCALHGDGAVSCWGSNGTAALGIGPADDEPHAPGAPTWPEP